MHSLHGMLLLLAVLLSSGHASAEFSCVGERQIVNCGQLPLYTAEQQAAYVSCCQANMITPATAAAEAQAAVTAASVRQSVQPAQQRADLETDGRLSKPINYRYGVCATRRRVVVPVFSGTQISQQRQVVPQALGRNLIKGVQNQAITWLATRPGNLKQIRSIYVDMAYANGASKFIHPAGISGPAELATMIWRISNPQVTSPQPGAWKILDTGEGIPPKIFSSNGVTWSPPTDCPAEGYGGPFAMPKVDIKYSGIEGPSSSGCPANFPPTAPSNNCGHISLVELDGQMCIKQAMAYHATKDERYAQTALDILEAWATTNTAFGMVKENGPLEAGWATASMAKALEMLRLLPRGKEVLPKFANWVNKVLMPVMEQYVFSISPNAINAGVNNVYGNWHLTIADAMISFGVLTDDLQRYNIGLELLRNATSDYLRWGRSVTTLNGIERQVGECSETLRDIYHSQFGFGSALQAMEVAFQQGDDVYMIQGHGMAAALELHARIILAYVKGEAPPAGYAWYNNGKALPASRAGTEWRFDISRQTWYQMDKATFKPAPDGDLKDGLKYLVGVKFLPTGWELGYNHYVGRLGMQLPQTRELLKHFAPEWWEMSWGLGTLAAADTAYQLWRPGMTWLNSKNKEQCMGARLTG